MKRVFVIALLALAVAGCRSVPDNAPTRFSSQTSARDQFGNQVITTDNRGQTALGRGQSFDTTEVDLVKQVKLHGDGPNGVTVLRVTRSAALAANVEQINKLDQKRKETAQAAVDALKAGLEQDYSRLIGEVTVLGKEIAQLVSEGNKGPGGDNKATTLLLATTAPGQVDMVSRLATLGEDAAYAEAGNRPTVRSSSDVRTEDTTTEAETIKVFDTIESVASNYVRYVELQRRDDKEDPAPTVIADQRDDGNPAVPDAGVPSDGDNNGLWKPVSENGKKLVVLLPANVGRASEVKVEYSGGSEVGRFSSIANGNRAHYRFGKVGSAYSGAKVVASFPGGVTRSFAVPKPGSRNTWRWESVKAAEPTPEAPASTNTTYKAEGDFLTVPADLVPHIIRVKLLHDDMANGKKDDAVPYRMAEDLGDGVYGVDNMSGAHAWFINAKLSYTGPVTERNAPGGWSNIVIDLPSGKFRPAKPGKG
jgi:hypothetical protein